MIINLRKLSYSIKTPMNNYEKINLEDYVQCGEEELAFIRAMVGVSRENFEATLDLIDQQYGSLSEYIENRLGFSKEEQQQLRLKYLTTKQD